MVSWDCESLNNRISFQINIIQNKSWYYNAYFIWKPSLTPIWGSRGEIYIYIILRSRRGTNRNPLTWTWCSWRALQCHYCYCHCPPDLVEQVKGRNFHCRTYCNRSQWANSCMLVDNRAWSSNNPGRCLKERKASRWTLEPLNRTIHPWLLGPKRLDVFQGWWRWWWLRSLMKIWVLNV